MDTLGDKVWDEKIKARLKAKEKEIEAYIEKTQDNISESKNKKEISDNIKEVKKVIVLKVVSWATPQTNIEENIPEEIANTPEKKEQATQTIQDSLATTDGNYSIIIKTKYNQTQALQLFRKFDTNTTIEYLYSDAGKNYFEVFIKQDSLFRQEMLEDIENGDIPESFLGVEIVQPEVFSIALTPTLSLEGEGEEQVDLSWEQLNLTWWIQKYLPETYLEELQTKSQINKIKVWVIDTWIDYNHPALQWKVSKWYDFVNDDNDAIDDQWHGTHVAWTIWAGINGKGIIWVNPFVELVPLKICNARWFCPSYAVIKSLEYAKEQKLDIVNMSLWGRTNPQGNPICAWISSLNQAGTIVVTAAGNSNVDTSTFVPGWCQNTITVAAIDQNNNRANFSNYGTKVDISAPWVDIYSTIPGGQYRQLSGTSMATPHVVWLVSILKTLDPSITTGQIKELFKQNQTQVYTSWDKYIAAGFNIQTALVNLTKKEEVVTEEVPVIQEPEIIPEEPIKWYDVEIVSDLQFIETIIQEKEEETENKVPQTWLIWPVQVGFWSE